MYSVLSYLNKFILYHLTLPAKHKSAPSPLEVKTNVCEFKTMENFYYHRNTEVLKSFVKKGLLGKTYVFIYKAVFTQKVHMNISECND
jgi:hypothetical protein